MIRKNIFKLMALALLMPAMMMLTACGNEEEVVNPEKTQNGNTQTENTIDKGYPLEVTVNVTRQDDGTRATYNESTKKLEFSAGDKLFVSGRNDNGAGQFAGTLDYVPATGKFSGTIYTRNPYSGTADALFSDAISIYATLLPNGYESTGFLYFIDNNTTEIYDDAAAAYETFAFVASETAKATGVEQLSWERASTYSNGFDLAPLCAVLNFTISGLEAGAQNVTLRLNDGKDYLVKGSVTPNALGVATFAIGVKGGANIRDMENNLTVGSSNFTLPSSTTFTAGKIYNITRSAIPGALIGQFSVGAEKKVYFSKGNLRYASSTWSFFDHQYDCYDDYSADAWDKFGWSTSSTTYGMSTSTNDYPDYSGDFVDWGAVMGEGWYTLSKVEWVYLFNTRSGAASKYGYATVNGVHGIIILPDAFVDPNKNKGSKAFAGGPTKDWEANEYTAANWALMEAAGAVFLPAAGYRSGDSVSDVGSKGDYWSSSTYSGAEVYDVFFSSSYPLGAEYFSYRSVGHAVRLVRLV